MVIDTTAMILFRLILLTAFIESSISSTITCEPGKDCHVHCDDLNACGDIHCPDDYHCFVNATSQSILAQNVIYGGNNGNLSMYCNAQNSCDQTVINCPVNGNCFLYADQHRSNYIKSNIQAQDSNYLYIDVTTVAALMSASIHCPITQKSGNQNNCIIKAVADAGFGYVTLHATKIYALESFTDLTYECYGYTSERSCSDNAEIYCSDTFTSSCIIAPVSIALDPITTWTCLDSYPSNVSNCIDLTLDPTVGPTLNPTESPTVKGICAQGKDCYIACNALDPCPSTIYCPDDFSCVINATSNAILQQGIIYGGNGGNLTMYCNGQSSCDQTVINCPMNGNCFLYAYEQRSNYIKSVIDAQNATYLYIDVTTVAALMSSSIHCPVTTSGANPNNCVIKAVGDAGNGYRTLYSTKIYAVGSFHDLTFECYRHTTERPCSDNAEMYCTDGFSKSCIIAPLSTASDPITEWNCLDEYPDNISECKVPTFAPTESPTDPTSFPTNMPTKVTMDPTTANPTTAPTYDPSASPSVSTAHPSGDPTASPSVNPTIDPTRNPSDLPTKDPSSGPTVSPSANPTIDPTRNPSDSPTTDPTNHPSSATTEEPLYSHGVHVAKINPLIMIIILYTMLCII
eukprot:71195_1